MDHRLSEAASRIETVRPEDGGSSWIPRLKAKAIVNLPPDGQRIVIVA
jgi:hypothetical protein